jgi:hypothetical protein
MQSEKKWPQGLKPALIFSLRGPEGPLFHGGAHSHGALTAVLSFMSYYGAYIRELFRSLLED